MRLLRGSFAGVLLLWAGLFWFIERVAIGLTRYNARGPKGAGVLVRPLGTAFLALTGWAKVPADRWLRPRYPRLWRKSPAKCWVLVPIGGDPRLVPWDITQPLLVLQDSAKEFGLFLQELSQEPTNERE